jgi:hypothetical protein
MATQASVGPGTAGLIRFAVGEAVSDVENRTELRGHLEDAERETIADDLVDEVKRLLLVEEGIDWQD